MDVVLRLADDYLLDRVWATVWPAVPRTILNTAATLASAAGAGQNGGIFQTSSKSASSSILDSFGNNFTATLANSQTLEHLQNAVYGASEWGSKWQGLSALPRDNFYRQCISLYAITYVGILLLYFSFATASYYLFFNKEMMKHPRFLKNQVRLEINASLSAFAPLDLLTLPWFVAEVRGHSKIYDTIDAHPWGWKYAALSIPFFLVFTDFCIYWVHRLEHHPRLYKHVHKPHHKWLVPTPFASHAFHPIDGYAQSLPYHIFVFLFPLHRWVYMGLFVFVNMWSILIHDSDMICNSPLEKIINGPSHHTLHHLYFTVNYGQYFTGCDRLGGSYRAPKAEDDPLLAVTGKGDKAAKEQALAQQIAESKKSV